MLNPIIYFKVVHARNTYLRAGEREAPMALDNLLEIAGDRRHRYAGARPHDAERILKLATTKKSPKPEEKVRLEKVRKRL